MSNCCGQGIVLVLLGDISEGHGVFSALEVLIVLVEGSCPKWARKRSGPVSHSLI